MRQKAMHKWMQTGVETHGRLALVRALRRTQSCIATIVAQSTCASSGRRIHCQPRPMIPAQTAAQARAQPSYQPQLFSPRAPAQARESAATPAHDPSPRDFWAAQATNLPAKPAPILGRILSQLQSSPRLWCQLQPRQSNSSSWITASLHSAYQPDSMIFGPKISL
ncbi:hypothetical protein TIFTF001_017036 [Ficus carica]|uniref:Uncharacterized protein n=1 Tax=Ficus carica TaxID=3494 RepID=A0AA88A8V2_FICCA|nr:hypothetical protein TIFTF001_017036 [Ficus carica]